MGASSWLLNFAGVLDFLIFFGVVLTFQIAAKRFFLRQKLRKVVAQSNDRVKAAFNPDAEQVEVDLRSLPNLNLAFYEEVTNELAALGFRAGPDIENVDLTAIMPWLRTAERTFFGSDGAVVANCFHLRTRGWRRLLQLLSGGMRDVYSVGFATLLEDGATIGTARSNMPSVFSYPDDMYGETLDVTTPLPEVLEAHIRMVQQVMNERRVDSIRPCRNAADYLAFLEFVTRKKFAHREKLGAVTAEEFENIADLSSSMNRHTRKMLRQEADRLVKRREEDTQQPEEPRRSGTPLAQ